MIVTLPVPGATYVIAVVITELAWQVHEDVGKTLAHPGPMIVVAAAEDVETVSLVQTVNVLMGVPPAPIFTEPLTSRVAVGAAVPIPTFPLEWIRIFSPAATEKVAAGPVLLVNAAAKPVPEFKKVAAGPLALLTKLTVGTPALFMKRATVAVVVEVPTSSR